MVYNTKVVCSYHTLEVFEETDDVTEEEKIFIRNAIYRQEFSDIFEIENNLDMIECNNLIDKLYEKIKYHNELKECMIYVAEHFMTNMSNRECCCMSNREKDGLIVLFSYDYMYLTHLCICELLEKGEISEINIKNLKKKICCNL